MKRVLRVLIAAAIFVLAVALPISEYMKPVTVYAQPNGICSVIGTFTATGTSVVFDNRTKGCFIWRVSYVSTGFSALSIQLEEAPDNAGVPGSFAAFTGATVVTDGANPSTSTNAATIGIHSNAAWVQLNLVSATGTGKVTYQTWGANSTQNIASGPKGATGMTGQTGTTGATGATGTTGTGVAGLTTPCITSALTATTLQTLGGATCPSVDSDGTLEAPFYAAFAGGVETDNIFSHTGNGSLGILQNFVGVFPDGSANDGMLYSLINISSGTPCSNLCTTTGTILSNSDPVTPYYGGAGILFGVHSHATSLIDTYNIGSDTNFNSAGTALTYYNYHLFDQIAGKTVYYIDSINPTQFVYGNGLSLSVNPTQTTVSGSTSGTAVFSQCFTGGTMKQITIYAASLLGTATYTFPTTFTHTPQVLSQSLAAIVTSVSVSAVTLTGTTSTGFITLSGF